jgi:hypothetical protein
LVCSDSIFAFSTGQIIPCGFGGMRGSGVALLCAVGMHIKPSGSSDSLHGIRLKTAEREKASVFI